MNEDQSCDISQAIELPNPVNYIFGKQSFLADVSNFKSVYWSVPIQVVLPANNLTGSPFTSLIDFGSNRAT